jgi:hypothetical protein
LELDGLLVQLFLLPLQPLLHFLNLLSEAGHFLRRRDACDYRTGRRFGRRQRRLSPGKLRSRDN